MCARRAGASTAHPLTHGHACSTPLQPVPPKPSGSKAEAALALAAHYDRLLVHLRASGCLVNAVKPEMLLDEEALDLLLAARASQAPSPTAAQAAEDAWAEMEVNYEGVSARAWACVLLQLWRVHVLGRVTPRALRSLPGSPKLTLPEDAALQVRSWLPWAAARWMHYQHRTV